MEEALSGCTFHVHDVSVAFSYWRKLLKLEQYCFFINRLVVIHAVATSPNR